MKFIYDAVEYTTGVNSDKSIDLFDATGALVAMATYSPCGEYLTFETVNGEFGDTHHVNTLTGFTELELAGFYTSAT